MTCGNVVYHMPGNTFVSTYCGLQLGHDGPCEYVPDEYLVQICKQVLIARGEVVAVWGKNEH